MHLADLQLVRPLPSDASRFAEIARRAGRLALVYTGIAAIGALVTLTGAVLVRHPFTPWVLIVPVLIALVALAARRTATLLRQTLRSWRSDIAYMRRSAPAPDVPQLPVLASVQVMRATPEEAIGTLFAKHYRLEALTQRASDASVFRATDTLASSTVALYLLPDHVVPQDADEREALWNNLRSAQAIDHPNVLNILDYGEYDGAYYVTMPFVSGYSLEELLATTRERQLSIRAAINIVRQVIHGIEAFHSHGVQHADLRPGNVLLDRDGRAMVELSLATEPVPASTDESAADVFAVGLLLYELLVGQKPFQPDPSNPDHIDYPLPPSEIRPEVSPDLNDIVLTAIRFDPHRSYTDVASFRIDLERTLTISDEDVTSIA